MLMLFLMGIVFSYVYLRTRNIVFAGLLHGSWNVPVFETQGDLIFIVIYALVIEVTRFIRVRTRKEKRGRRTPWRKGFRFRALVKRL